MAIRLSELVSKIFSKLPVRSVLRFMSLSKFWYGEMSTESFIQTNLLQNKDSDHHVLLYMNEFSMKSCSINSLLEGNGKAVALESPMKDLISCIVGSTHGLVCISVGFDLYLWNPSLQEHKKLKYAEPNPMKFRPNGEYTFGYDSLHKDYKIVAIFLTYARDEQEMKLYSLKSDSWKTVVCCGDEILSGCGQLLKDKLHWMVEGGGSIQCFDLAEEKWANAIKLPTNEEHSHQFLWLGVLDNQLSLLSAEEEYDLGFWVLKNHQSWTFMYKIKLDKDNGVFNQIKHPLFFLSSKGKILIFFGETSLIHNLRDQSTTKCIIEVDNKINDAVLYVDSKVLPFRLT